MSSVAFLVEEAGKNIRRNGLMSVAALTTVTVAMAVLGGALFALYRLHQFADTQSRQFEIRAFADVGLSRDRTADVCRRVAGLPGVAAAVLYTKEEAWAMLQRSDLARKTHITTDLGDINPLPDRIDVRPADPRRTQDIAAALRDRARFPEITRVLDDRDTLDKVLATARLVRNVGGAAALLLFLATAFVIQNTIRLTVFARRKEVRIMQLVGATAGFIRLPLMLEGVFYGVVGGAIAGGLVLFVVHQVSVYVTRFSSPLGAQMPAAAAWWVVLGLLVVIGGLVGLSGSVLSIHRFLRKA